jgi:hypothetical protein
MPGGGARPLTDAANRLDAPGARLPKGYIGVSESEQEPGSLGLVCPDRSVLVEGAAPRDVDHVGAEAADEGAAIQYVDDDVGDVVTGELVEVSPHGCSPWSVETGDVASLTDSGEVIGNDRSQRLTKVRAVGL